MVIRVFVRALDTQLDHYATRLIPKRVVYLKEMSRGELMGLNGIGETQAGDIIRELNPTPFRNRQDIQERVHIAEGRWRQMQSTPGVEVRIYRR